MGGIGAAHAKLILFGEHAAVYGHPAVGMALPECITVKLFGEPTNAWNVEGVPVDDRPSVLGVLARMEGHLPAVRPCSVQITSSVPRGVGFGSSAALCGAFARALIGGNGKRVWELAHAAEKIFHGTPSGVDTGLSLLGGMCAVFPRSDGLPEAERLPGAPVWLVVAGVARDEACGALVAGLGARMKAGDLMACAAVSALGDIAREALRALREPSGTDLARRLGRMADAAMSELRSIGLANPTQDRLIEAGMLAGALGGKLSGAGAGGAFFFVTSDEKSAGFVSQAVQEEARKAGITLSAPVRVVYAGNGSADI